MMTVLGRGQTGDAGNHYNSLSEKQEQPKVVAEALTKTMTSRGWGVTGMRAKGECSVEN